MNAAYFLKEPPQRTPACQDLCVAIMNHFPPRGKSLNRQALCSGRKADDFDLTRSGERIIVADEEERGENSPLRMLWHVGKGRIYVDDFQDSIIVGILTKVVGMHVCSEPGR